MRKELMFIGILLALTPTFLTGVILLEKEGTAQDMPNSSPSTQPSAPPMTNHGGGFQRPIVYSVSFQSVNASVNGNEVNGTGQVVLDGGHFGVSYIVSGVFPDSTHMSHIHKGPDCPTAAQDTNGDGVIDVIEAGVTDGGILVNLDGDLSTFDAGSDHISSPDLYGNLFYIGSGSYSSMIDDLHRPAPDPKTGIITLAPGENFDLDHAVIVIHGINPGKNLPGSAQSVKGFTSNQSLPIACGKLKKLLL